MKLHQKFFLLLVLLLPVQLGRHFWPNWSYVIGLRIDYLSPTIYLTDVLVFLILFFWFADKLKTQNSKGKITTKNLKLIFFPISIFLFLLVNSFLAKNQGTALYKFFKILELSFLGFYVAKNKIKLSIIHFSLSIAIIYSSLLAIAQFIRQSSLNGIFWFLGERTFSAGTPGIAKAVVNGQLLLRPYATFPHPNALAGFLLISLILTVPYIYRKSKLLTAIYLLLAICVIVLTFSRSVWLVGLLIVGLTVIRSKHLRVLNYGLVFFMGEALIQRAELNKIALQLIRQHFFAGVGLNNFIVYLPRFWPNPNPIYLLQPVHNIYLLILAEMGITGLLIFLYLIIKTLKNLLKIALDPSSGRGYNWQLIISLLVILLTGMVDHYWLTLQQTQLLLAIVLGFSWSKSAKIGS